MLNYKYDLTIDLFNMWIYADKLDVTVHFKINMQIFEVQPKFLLKPIFNRNIFFACLHPAAPNNTTKIAYEPIKIINKF